MAFRITQAEAAARYAVKFPGKGLAWFQGTNRECSIICPIHGIVCCATYKSVFESKHGCPSCALASRTKNAEALGSIGVKNSAYAEVIGSCVIIHCEKLAVEIGHDNKITLEKLWNLVSQMQVSDCTG